MSECRYNPLFGRVIIKREIEEVTKGGIIIANAKKHSKSQGVVVAIGPSAEGVSIGDTVIFGKNAGAWLDSTYTAGNENDDGTFFICQDEDILAVING